MLQRLTIQNYALIESLDIDFPDGLVIMTGETGAGKSVLLGAISLLLGGKADLSVIRDDKKNCVVEALFDIEGQQKILRRVINPASLRSRFFIDDEPVPASQMEAVASSLLDIHSQHSNLLLGNPDFQMEMLDGFIKDKNLLAAYRSAYGRVKELEKTIDGLSSEIAHLQQTISGRADDLRRLEEASLKEGEVETLEQEEKQLENAESLKENADQALSLLDGESSSAIRLLAEAAKRIRKCSEFVPSLENLASRLESCKIECRDISSDVEKFSSSVSASPMRLIQVQERLSQLYSLMKRYSCKDERELLEHLSSLSNSAENVDELILRRKELEAELSSCKDERKRLADDLSSARVAGAEKMRKQLLSSIRMLEMPAADFEVEVVPCGSYTYSGQDSVRFLFSANPKEKMLELHKVASGGELSRIMLCIKSMMASFMKMPTVFFDEIDVGVSGSVADKMGQQIVKMGSGMQVFAITHLPQVASKGVAHILVYKETSDNGRSAIRLKYLDAEERIDEVARLLSGEKTTRAALDNARELMGIAPAKGKTKGK